MCRIAARWIAILALFQLACGATRSPTFQGATLGEHRTEANERPSTVPSSLVTRVASVVPAERVDDWDCSRQFQVKERDLGSPSEEPDEPAVGTLDLHLNEIGPPANGQKCSESGQRSVVEPSACRDHQGALAALAQALETADVRQRDRRLARLEACHSLMPGLVTALRAEFDPACGDVVAEGVLNRSHRPAMLQIRATLVALAYAARVTRVVPMPRFTGNGDRENIERYRTNTVRPWVAVQRRRIEASRERLKMFEGAGYPHAIGAMALATAWSRVYAAARGAPIPEAIKREYEQRSRYYGMMDEELSPIRKQALGAHAEAAVLVSRQGIRHSPVADQWFTAVGAVANRVSYSAAEHMSIPKPADCAANSAVERLARRLPAFYAGLLITGPDLVQPCVVRGLIDQGLSPAHRRAWQRPPAEIASLLAHGHVALARRGFDRAQFDEALRQLIHVRAFRQQLTADEELLAATACAARNGVWELGPADSALVNTGTAFQPLVRYAKTAAPQANRSLALLNAALLAPMAGLAFAEQAHGLFHEAIELAKGTSALPCVKQNGWLFGASPWLERRTTDPCVIVEPL